MTENEPKLGPRRRSREKLAGGLVDFLVAPDLPKPQKATGELAKYMRRFGYPEDQIMPREEEAARKAADAECWRKLKKKHVVLTVGLIEAIDAECERLKRLGFGPLASREKVIDAAIATLRDSKARTLFSEAS